MAYQAKKHKRFREDFELVDENGIVVRTLHVDLDADDMVVRINRKYTALTRILGETSDMKKKAETAQEVSERFERLGRAIVDLLETVFGTENAKTLLDFYENRYIELTKEVTPFITQVVIPRCIEIKNENKKSILKGYNRKTRRKLFGR